MRVSNRLVLSLFNARLLRQLAQYLLLAVVAMPAVAADPLTTVRIASIASLVDGQSKVSGGQSAVVAQQGELAKRLLERGIKLEWIPIPAAVGGPAFNEALANGSTDFASYGDFPAIIAKANGIDIKMIVPAGRGTNSYLIAANASGAKSLNDLKGKRIALHRGRPLELAFSQLIAANGLNYSDFKIVNINNVAGGAALASGDVDALFTGADAYLLEDKGIGKIIWSTKGTAWKWRAELFVRSEFEQQHPDITQIVATEYVKASYWSSQEVNRAEVIKLATRLGTPADVIARDYENDLRSWPERWSPLFDPALVQHYHEAVEFAVNEKLIRKGFDAKSWFDQRFLDAALHELKLENYWTPRPAVQK